MFSMFKRDPSKDKLETIINNATKILSNIVDHPDPGNGGITHETAVAFSNRWIRTSSEPTWSNKIEINDNFEQILLDVDCISKHRCSRNTKELYLLLIEQYDAKIKQVYQLK